MSSERQWARTIRTPDGVTRHLGLIPSVLYGAGELPTIPPSAGEIVPLSELRAFDSWPSVLPVLDQGSWNACTWFASCQSLQYARYQNGQAYVPLDPLCAYLRVTGGRNTGTNLLQAARLPELYGIPPADRAPTDDLPAEAARFRLQLTDSLQSWPQILSEVARRRPVAGSVCVGPNWMRLDGEGCMGLDGGQANHAIFLGGGLKFSRVHGWMIKHCGSWGPFWGEQGFGWFSEAHYEKSTHVEAYVSRAVREDMADDIPPPVAIA
jgi:hypothetical protein